MGGDTVVLLHGGPGAGIPSIRPAVEPLSERFTLVLYDQRGGGRSELPADTALLAARYHVEDLEAVRRHFGLDRMKLLAHSFRPLIAARYAMAHPEHLERMVFHGATGPVWEDAVRAARRSGASSPDPALPLHDLPTLTRPRNPVHSGSLPTGPNAGAQKSGAPSG